ncbi:MAG TPA: AraC family transcriptional regulator [Phycisphaerae bacterium]|nr:AraC family transcriptional regulator [Phycisphaerae bacterium]HRW52395.1 AraC family transcriptional regulator [Phycisphaerae bacterium]
MDYAEISPIPPLAPYVRCLWTLRAPATSLGDAPDRVLPDGHAEIIINRAAPFTELRDDGDVVRQENAIVAAQMTRFILIQPTNEVDLVGIRFHATGLHALIGADQRELVDRRIPLADVDSKLWRRLVAAALADDEFLTGTQSLLLSTLERRTFGGAEDIARAATWMRHVGGQCRVAAIADRLGMTTRQLERRFLAEVGVTPKRYARILRFDALVRSAQGGLGRDWTTLAHVHGFHDQAHFNREFRAIAGQTPTQFARSENLLTSLFTSG